MRDKRLVEIARASNNLKKRSITDIEVIKHVHKNILTGRVPDRRRLPVATFNGPLAHLQRDLKAIRDCLERGFPFESESQTALSPSGTSRGPATEDLGKLGYVSDVSSLLTTGRYNENIQRRMDY